MVEEVFDDVKGMLDEGPHRGFRLLRGLEGFFLQAVPSSRRAGECMD